MRFSLPATTADDHTRANGRQRGTLTVDHDNVVEPGRGLYVTATDGSEAVGFWLREVDGRKLAETLAEHYGLVPLVDPKVGDEVTVAPNSRYSGGPVSFYGATRFKLAALADDDGDFSVEALDGERPGRTEYVLGYYLRPASAVLPKAEVPAEPPKPSFEPGQAVVLTEAHGGLPAGTAALVKNGATLGSTWRVYTATASTSRQHIVPESKLAPLVLAAAPLAEPKLGDVFELARPYRLADGQESYLSRHGSTRVRIVALPDSDGDYHVEALNGLKTGERGYVDRAHFAGLAPIIDRPWAVGDDAVVTEDRPSSARLYAGDRVRVVGTEGDSIYVDFVSGRGRAFPYPRGWIIRPSALRRP